MKFSACVGLFTLIICAVAIKGVVPSAVLANANSDRTLTNFLLSPDSEGLATDPAASAACFTKYLPILNEISNTFQTQYQACITLADQEIAALTAGAQSNRNDFMQTAQAFCTAYSACNQNTQALDFFTCYATVSSNEIPVMYNLSTEATSAAAYISQQLTVIQNDKYACVNATEKTYVDNTASTYTLLDSCLAAADSSTLSPITVNIDDANVESFVVQTDESQSQSQSGSGIQSQSQCSGSNCGKFKPLRQLMKDPPMHSFH